MDVAITRTPGVLPSAESEAFLARHAVALRLGRTRRTPGFGEVVARHALAIAENRCELVATVGEGGESGQAVEAIVGGNATQLQLETITAEVSERGATRMDDKTSDASMEKRKKDGYF